MTPRRRAVWCLLAILLLLVAVNVRWILRYRVGQPYEIDESGYLTYALFDLRGLLSGGLRGWVAAIEAPSYQAPLVTAVTSLVFAVMGAEPAWGFATMVLSGVVVVWAGYLLGRDAGGDRTAIAAALLLACNPAILNSSRHYSFALPAAAVLALALLALTRSRGFQSAGWAAAFGVLAGLLPLTRTMTIAFLPGLGLAALVAALASGNVRLALLRLAGAGVLALAVMATWLVPNGRYVLEYLTEFGYGRRAELYGKAVSFDPLDQALRLFGVLCEYMFVPAVAIMLLGLLCLAWPRRGGWGWLRSPLLPLAIVGAEGLAALMSSRNQGSGFVTPLIPPLMVLAAAGLVRAARPGWRAAAVYGALAIALLLPALSMADLETRLAHPRRIPFPVLEAITVANGTGYVQEFEQRAGYGSALPTMPVPRDEGRRWMETLRRSGERIHRLSGDANPTTLGIRGYLYNANSLNFARTFAGHPVLPLIQINAELVGDTAADYARYLQTGDAAASCQLLTAGGTIGEIHPPVTEAFLVDAAQRSGFEPVEQWTLPDERVITLWQRPRSTVPCPPRP